ncbi:uncharacterized protein N0V89_000062 [Didymosphaeria variabile]|uniref:Uncharacterized protein n=1 Tax=Didymosphaeria variabile TaxID=1932322 RepID=A0A9W9CFD7_9PLEO|nr:uncharacterized protein N0V89_000062 [Didymosphaeria variabile]KAJ4359507.1 hypothetical protein N0V89_000062 [Didymosphaeria variabile]
MTDNNTDQVNTRSSLLPTQEGDMNAGRNYIDTPRIPTSFADRDITDSEAAGQDDLFNVESDPDHVEEPETRRLPASPSLDEENVSYTSEASSKSEEDWAKMTTSDIPELDIGLSVDAPPGIAAEMAPQDLNFLDSDSENDDEVEYMQRADLSSGASITWKAINEASGMLTVRDDDNASDYQYVEEDREGDAEDSDVISRHQEEAMRSPTEEPNAVYEDIGLDRKYFDHDYFLEYYGLAREQWTAHGDGSDIRADYPDMEEVKPDSDPARSRATNSTRKKKKHVFHEDEDAWLTLFFEKLKAVIESGKNVEIPSEAMMYKCFNNFFEGKVLKDSDGQPLSPRVARYTGTIHKHLRRPGAVKMVAVREEILSMMEDRAGGQLYVPVITDDDIQQYLAGGTYTVDDPDDKEKNHRFALSVKEIKLNETLRATANKKRKQAAQGSPSSFPQQTSSPKQAPIPEQTTSAKQSPSPQNTTSLQKSSFTGNVQSSHQTRPPTPSLGATAQATDAMTTDIGALDREMNIGHSEGYGMDDDGPLPTIDPDIEDSSKPVTVERPFHIEADPFWQAHMEGKNKKKLPEGSGQGFDDHTDVEVAGVDHEEQGRPAKKLKMSD